ncbi:MAG: hypothetical protein ACTS73_04295 [Arsenophonus sp. NEOnobi-MAG3]
MAILRLKCLRSIIVCSGNGIYFNSSLLSPYLKRAKSVKELHIMGSNLLI